MYRILGILPRAEYFVHEISRLLMCILGGFKGPTILCARTNFPNLWREMAELKQYTFKWNKEQTEAFIRHRVEHRHLFTGGRDTAANGYRTILAKMGVMGKVTHTQAKKKWDNLKTKYKECKCPASGQGTDDGKPTAATWPWFVLMDEALGQSAAGLPPGLIASIKEDNPGPSTAQEGQRGRGDEDEEEKYKDDTERQRGGGGGTKKREREDPFLNLLREDLLYQREAEERRAAEARERFERFFALLERFAPK
ncbi:uncharacterized protein LOC117542692 [Gymnodraco acuticeps]|uniref:Uncharacterized protein LOC117542692 n=1 Tax=Gymnodraco acuticeps TaxID=8218 RepID=A0A6P8TQ83_GYMAC|nr:uncharacterized protein LOC117542692 [Gymnodraco acuticeps]